MNKYETGIGTMGIAVPEFKTSSWVDDRLGNSESVNNPQQDQFVWLYIDAKNFGSVNSDVNPNYFTLSTDDGYTADYNDVSFDTKYLDATTLSPGTYSSGWLIFEVPIANEYTLHFNSFNGSVDKKIIMSN